MPSRSIYASRGILGGADLVIGDDPIRDGQGRVTLSRFMEPGFGRRKILGVAQFSQLDESAVVQRVVGLCRRQVSLRLIDGNRGLGGICASVAQDRVDTFFLSSIVRSSDANSAATFSFSAIPAARAAFAATNAASTPSGKAGSAASRAATAASNANRECRVRSSASVRAFAAWLAIERAAFGLL